MALACGFSCVASGESSSGPHGAQHARKQLVTRLHCFCWSDYRSDAFRKDHRQRCSNFRGWLQGSTCPGCCEGVQQEWVLGEGTVGWTLSFVLCTLNFFVRYKVFAKVDDNKVRSTKHKVQSTKLKNPNRSCQSATRNHLVSASTRAEPSLTSFLKIVAALISSSFLPPLPILHLQ